MCGGGHMYPQPSLLRVWSLMCACTVISGTWWKTFNAATVLFLWGKISNGECRRERTDRSLLEGCNAIAGIPALTAEPSIVRSQADRIHFCPLQIHWVILISQGTRERRRERRKWRKTCFSLMNVYWILHHHKSWQIPSSTPTKYFAAGIFMAVWRPHLFTFCLYSIFTTQTCALTVCSPKLHLLVQKYTVKTAILWNLQSSNLTISFNYILKYKMFPWWQNWIFSIIIPVLSVTWSFRKTTSRRPIIKKKDIHIKM